MSSKIKGKVPDHDLSNLPKSDIHVWFYEYFLVKSCKFQKKFSSQIPRTGSQWFEFNILSKISNSFCDYFSYCRSIQYVSPRFWEPACTYTWQPYKFWILKHLGTQQFFNCCFRLHIKSMSGGYLGLGGFIPTGIRPLRWIIAIFRTYLYTNSILCLLSEAFHNWLRWKMQVVEDVLLHRNKIAEFDSSNKIFFH